LASFGIVALIVSAIGMFNTMTIALLERTQEIGIMKALGATSADIWSMFLSESVIIGFLGGAGGIGIGMAGGEVFNYGINFLAGAMGGKGIDLFFTPLWFILLIITFSTFVGLITGFYPAKRAANINCLAALRYK
jgi:putative ABC transport system permease protein